MPLSSAKQCCNPWKNGTQSPMRKINLKDVSEQPWASPKGTFGGVSKEVSVALGRNPESNERHPFDIELARIPPGKTTCPYHSHTCQCG
jgi:hypothetical protein